MAGDWIKMRTDLADDPAVIAVASNLSLEEDVVVGKLHRLWSWANRHTADGNAPGVTYDWLDRYIGVTGLCEALEAVGWMDSDGASVTIPNFERHNSQSAKRRALTAKRVAKCRNARGVTREEKRREEKKKDKNPPTPLFTPPTLEEVTAYCAERAAAGNPPVDPQQWYDHYTANGWMVGRVKMKDWRGAVRTWEKNEFRKGRQHGTDKPSGRHHQTVVGRRPEATV